MQSTHRAFKDYFGVVVGIDDRERNIILAQACRHSIVHDGGKVNPRILNQVRNAKPRTLKENIELESEIKFSLEEIKLISNEMKSYIRALIDLCSN